MFILLLKYIKPLEEIDRLLENHIRYLEKYYEEGKFICSGRRNPRTGGVIIANTSNREEIEGIISEDPFLINKAAQYEIIEFIPTKYNSRFSCFVN
ncbi:YciI family protein [Pelotomaculum propionicicum]|uniref:YCII-related domain-containing protein n=1 Tax=Pelotomaculum propionicicum TaxID=258475 RepID=A0A4Y7RP05_9FIRM|nr:YciI family protein [Pelotomaculum propionicicum]NLI12391.1 YciI family protein [Peptococcaceae bacterium]TEB10047.1 hypothetical protein Pmgp_02640 [Pelotomaculum propionicicum]